MTGRGGRFRVRVPPGVSRVLTVLSPGVGGLQGARRKLNLRVPWSSTLRIRPRSLAPGGRIRLSGRLRLRGVALPRSGKRVELQAFDARPLARVRDDARVRPARPLGARATGSARAPAATGSASGSRTRARSPFDRGYSRPVTVRVG